VIDVPHSIDVPECDDERTREFEASVGHADDVLL
jgi:hypothetical protein